jgi:RNA polymerase sigma-70 factor (sigma-E family)
MGHRCPRSVEDDDFAGWVAARGAVLLRSAVLLTGDRGHAEDLLQNALIRTYGAWGRIRRRESVDAYARQVMYSLFLNSWRRRWRGEVPTGQLPEHTRADDVDRVELGPPLSAALGRLPVKMRAVVVLRYYDDLPDAEIARLLNCSVGTVRSQASRALAKLRADGAVLALVEEGP